MSSAPVYPEPPADRGPAGPPLRVRRASDNPLGVYLRARRELVTPEQAGIPDVGVRRTPGLRREEVAQLAGISADYYLRLERGRDRNPSIHVLDALARVLRLDADHVGYLRSLVADAPPPHARRPRTSTLPGGARKLLDSLVQPAFIEDGHFDIVAANPLAAALDPGLREGGNQLRDLFLDPEVRTLYPEWQRVTECLVFSLRQSAGTGVDDPRLGQLTDELSAASGHFSDLWERHEVRGQHGAPVRIDHPEVGELTLNRERLSIAGAEDLGLVLYHADAGSVDAEKLALLASVGQPAGA